MKEPTDLRQQRKQSERRLVVAVVVVLLGAGLVLVGLIYDWGTALSALICLLPGAAILLLLWLLLLGIERLIGE